MYDKATDPLGFPDAQERVSKLDTCAHWWHFPGTCCALRPERPEMKHASLKCPAGSETRHLESQARQDLRRRRGTFSDPGHLDHVVTQQKTFDSKAQTLGPKLCQIDPATGHSRSRCCRKPDKYIYIYIYSFNRPIPVTILKTHGKCTSGLSLVCHILCRDVCDVAIAIICQSRLDTAPQSTK